MIPATTIIAGASNYRINLDRIRVVNVDNVCTFQQFPANDTILASRNNQSVAITFFLFFTNSSNQIQICRLFDTSVFPFIIMTY